MLDRRYQECIRCVMDTSDIEIIFDEKGICNHCHRFDTFTKRRWMPNDEGMKKLSLIINKIKLDGRNKEYDCIIGLSGGVDSTYLAYRLKDFNLRPLVVHIDTGWNSELAVYNIEKIVNFCGYDLFTHVMDWEEIRDLQLAYLKAGIANQDVVQDHAIFATLYHFAVKNNIRYVISGGNIATESVFPDSWQHSAMDAVNLHAIHKKFGIKPLKNYKTISLFDYCFYYPFIKGMKTIRPLNFMPYSKARVLDELIERVGYKKYGRKHGESRFTKFFQNYYLPTKFGFDKRRPHLSSQILSGEITRDQALEVLNQSLYDSYELNEDISYISKKLNITEEELISLINEPGRSYNEYRNWDKKYTYLKKLQTFVLKALNLDIKNYA